MDELAIEVRGLRKFYGELEAVKGIDLSVQRGEVFCLIGPNGAGKTTTLEILEGHRPFDEGDVWVLGDDPALHHRSLRERTGIVLQQTGVERFLTVEETIRQFRGYYRHPLPVDRILEMVGLTEKRKSLVRRLSGGQMRRLDVAVALAGDSELLFLDEPTTGFDPAARRGAWEMVRGLRQLGKTILLTTHYMDEAENLADRVAIISGGEIMIEGTIAELRHRFARTVISFRLPENGVEVPRIARAGRHIADGRVRIETEEPTRTVYELTRWAAGERLELEDFNVRPAALEDIYLDLVGSEAGEE